MKKLLNCLVTVVVFIVSLAGMLVSVVIWGAQLAFGAIVILLVVGLIRGCIANY